MDFILLTFSFSLCVDGYIVGSVGVSGATSDEDEFLGLEGVKSLHNESLLTVPAAHCCTTLKIAEG